VKIILSAKIKFFQTLQKSPFIPLFQRGKIKKMPFSKGETKSHFFKEGSHKSLTLKKIIKVSLFQREI